MSVLIKGMDMPKSCRDCDLAKHFDGYNENDCPFNAFSYYDCPLVDVPTSHGRLIDADELKRNTMVIFSGTIREKEIDEATTIIEAEK